MRKLSDNVNYTLEARAVMQSTKKTQKELEKKFIEAFNNARNNTESGHTKSDGTGVVKYSLIGRSKDGKGIYESNFPQGTPKSAKSQKILDYITNVWSKNPIKLVISNGETSRTILAQFDPAVDTSQNIPTDASKLAGGNRHGNHTEQRVTLDLADDYYQIASEAVYNYSKEETGKDTKTHIGVKMWHYFVNDIYFAEYGQTKLTPYTVTINVKEKADGNFVYSFSAERTKEPSTRQTLHAAVNARKGANGELFIDSIPETSEKSNSFEEKSSEKSSIRESETLSHEVLHFIREGDNNAQIKIGMTDNERADVLKKKVISPQKINVSENFDIDFEHLQNDQLKIVKSALVKKLRELGHLKKYQTNNVDVEFEFTAGGLKKSMNSQVYEYGGSLADLAKVVMNMQLLLDNSILLEIHSDKAVGSPKENPQLVQTYVLLSAFFESGEITPVQFEVKQYIDNENRLYLAVALTKIETDVISDTMLDKNQTSTRLLPVSNISIPDLIQKINPRDKNFFKYIPDEFLSESQLEAKQRALKIEDVKYSRDKTKSSIRESETLSARDMILDSLANTGFNKNEQRSIEAYRKRVRRINSLVEERSKVNRELAELVNVKGSEASAKRSALQVQKKNLTQSIEREEEHLLNQEKNSYLKKVVTEVMLKRIAIAAERQDISTTLKYTKAALELYDRRMNERLSKEEEKRIREAILTHIINYYLFFFSPFLLWSISMRI